MFADVLVPPSPTGVFDWYMVGCPAALIALLAVTASLVAVFVVLSRRFKGLAKGWILLICFALFVVADLAVFFIGLNNPSLWRTPTPLPPRPIETERKP